MNRFVHPHRPASDRARGFSLVEAVVACAIAGGLLVAAMSAVGATAGGRKRNEERELGIRLARDLLAEVLAKRYADDADPENFGLEIDETPSRIDFDDVDDYDGLLDKPASSPEGEPVTSQIGWQRQVTVRFATRDDLDIDDSTDSGLKRIVVTVSKGDGHSYTLSAIRVAAWDALMEAR